MKRTTIKDVARASGCSISTVSLALSSKPAPVAPDTRERIRKIAAQLNYSPNQIAVSLKTRRSNMIGIVMADLRNPHMAGVFMEIDGRLRESGYSLICCTTGGDEELDSRRINDLIACGIDGIIFANPAMYTLGEKWRQIEKLAADSSLPAVGRDNDRFYQEGFGSSVSVNYEGGAYLAVKHLLELGHVQIGCITGPMGMHVTRARLDGYKKALAEYGIGYDPELIYEGDYETDSGYAALPCLLGKNVTAVFSFNDNMAFGLYKNARACGIRIPQDLSVIGFDDVSFDELLDVPLTSVSIHADEIGASIADEIMRLIDGGASAACRSILFEPSLMVRGSTRRRER